MTDEIRPGLFAVNMHPTARPHELADIARLAEDLGYESLWAGEHPILPDPPGPYSPFDPELELVDPIVTLSFLAGVTSTLKLGTGIIILPLRNPVILAKQLASVDVLAGGRLIFGFGTGYIPTEFDAVGVPFRERGARTEEYLEAMRSLWHDDAPGYQGKHVSLDQVNAYPRPAQKDLHVVGGGHSIPALRRATTHAHGWYGFGLPPLTVRRFMSELTRLSQVYERPDVLGPSEITVTPPRGGVDAEKVRQYRGEGVDRLLLYPPEGLTVAELREYLTEHAAHFSR